MQERRRLVRRQADKELLKKVQELQTTGGRRDADGSKEMERRRRRVIRHNCRVRIEMLIGMRSGNSDTWSVDAVKLKGRVLDLSVGGASLFTKQPFETGQELRLGVNLPDGSEINTHATVRWVKAVPEKDAYASGVQFMHVSAKDSKKLVKFLEDLDATVGL